MTTAVEARTVVRAGLDSSVAVALPTDDAWDDLWVDIRDEKLIPALAQAVDAGTVHATRRQLSTIRRAHEETMYACVLLERNALEELDRLDCAGIDARLLKGAASAHLDYPDPAWRGFGDVDLLVRPESFDATVALLRATGATRRSAEPRPGFDRKFGKGVCMIRSDRVQIDVHRSLATGPFGVLVDTDDLFATAESFRLGGVEVQALDRDLRLLHACFHAALGDFPPRLVALRDVAQMLLHPSIDIDRVRMIADRWRSGVVVASAVATAWSVLGLVRTDAVNWAFAYVPTRFERTALAAYLGDRRSYARQMAAAVPALPNWRARLDYVSALVFPDRGYVRSRDGGYSRRIRRALRAGVATGVSR